MKQAVIKKGVVMPVEVPRLTVQPNFVLIKVRNSCVSAGTEMKAVNNSGKSLVRRAIESPELVAKAKQIVVSSGVKTLKSIIKTHTEFGLPIGYSVSGEVVAVGEGVNNFSVGDRVAAAGAGYAEHSNYVNVPENLVVKMPKNVSFEEASTVTLGTIAMQGVRRAEVQLGEQVVVFGLGIIGQICSQLLVGSGCRVIGVDLDQKRLEIAKKNGAAYIINGSDSDLVEHVIKLTGGHGADAVIFTAATDSSKPLSDCFKMSRKKGRVVLVGASGMEINREDIYKKELDFLISTSYGPGRYDSKYEEEGNDYPYAYVRWTENRNMEEYLNQIEFNRMNVKSLIDEVFPIEEVDKAYASYQTNDKPLIVLLSYVDNNVNEDEDEYTIRQMKEKVVSKDIVKYAVIGAGSFVKGVHMTNLEKMKDKFHLKAVMSRSGHSAKNFAEQFGAEYYTTDYQRILDDETIDLVIITTRHHLHADLAIKALNNKKAVFVEKPPALNQDELNSIVKTIGDTGMPYMVGYNRRFSKYAVEIEKLLNQRVGPTIINYMMNAPYYPKDHWVHGPEGGGRIIGEGCHIIDLFQYLIGKECVSITVNSIDSSTNYYSNRDNVIVTLKYEDGSLANLTYCSIGNTKYPKEEMTVLFDGKLITMSDYKELMGYGINIKKLNGKTPEKGFVEELEYLYRAVSGKGEKYPISINDIESTSRITFAVENETARMRTEDLIDIEKNIIVD